MEIDTAKRRSGKVTDSLPGAGDGLLAVQLDVTTDPPLRLPLGSDCVITSVVKELSQWRGLALSTDYKSG
jgi:hypothetical protein